MGSKSTKQGQGEEQGSPFEVLPRAQEGAAAGALSQVCGQSTVTSESRTFWSFLDVRMGWMWGVRKIEEMHGEHY